MATRWRHECLVYTLQGALAHCEVLQGAVKCLKSQQKTSVDTLERVEAVPALTQFATLLCQALPGFADEKRACWRIARAISQLKPGETAAVRFIGRDVSSP
jgi:hypothetical protein